MTGFARLPDHGQNGGDHLLQRHEAGGSAAGGRQIFGQALSRWPGELDEACGAGGRGLGDRQPERLECQRQSGRMKIPGRQNERILRQHERIVGAAVELDFDDFLRAVDRVEKRAVYRRQAAHR